MFGVSLPLSSMLPKEYRKVGFLGGDFKKVCLCSAQCQARQWVHVCTAEGSSCYCCRRHSHLEPGHSFFVHLVPGCRVVCVWGVLRSARKWFLGEVTLGVVFSCSRLAEHGCGYMFMRVSTVALTNLSHFQCEDGSFNIAFQAGAVASATPRSVLHWWLALVGSGWSWLGLAFRGVRPRCGFGSAVHFGCVCDARLWLVSRSLR